MMQIFFRKHDLRAIKNKYLLVCPFLILCNTIILAGNRPITNLSYTSFNITSLIADGTIQGKVSDAETNETLVGVTVIIKGTSLGSTTDIEGQYIIQNIAEGTYEVSISYVGYETAVVPDVKVIAGQTTTLNYKLTPASTQLQDIEIVGDKALSGKVIETNEVSMLNSIKTSSLIVTGISAQQIARSVDQDAGEVAKRLPGVTVLSNFVNIRGMHERYNLTILNGMVAPSSEADRRAFSYDLLPSNMIDKMTVYRSPAPELLADWAGGVIKIETKNSSIAREIEINLNTSYRSNSSFKDYYTYEGGKKDWMGMDDGTRALPDAFPEIGAIPAGELTNLSLNTRTLSKYSQDEIAANAELGINLYNNWNLMKASSGLDYRAGINYYDSRKFGKMRLSNLTSINTTQSTLIRYQEFNPLIRLKEGQINETSKTSYQDTISQKVSRWGLLQNLALSISPRHAVQLNGLFNQLGTDEMYVRDGYDATSEPVGYATKMIYTYRSRTLLGLQASGKHGFGYEDNYLHTITWAAAYNSSTEEIPGQRILTFRPPAGGSSPDENTPRFLDGSATRFNINNHLFYSTTKEENTIFSLDYEKKFSFGPAIKMGFFNENKRKPLNSRLIKNHNVEKTLRDSSLLINQFNADAAFRGSNYRDDGSGLWISDDSDISGQYDVTGKITAGYGAINIPLLNNRLKIYGGVRYEGQDLLLVIPPSEYLTKSLGKKAELIDRYIYYWLPSVNASWNFTEKILVRAAYGKTINRPNYRELIPIEVNDPRLENKRVGNDTLKDAQIHNLDFRIEYYPTESEFISVGIYYKKLINAIEPYVESLPSSEVIYYDNTKVAMVLGLEAEVRKSLNFLPWKWADNLSTIANFAILKSEIELRDGLVPNNTGDFRDSRTAIRPLEGTAAFVVNTGLYYDHEKWGTKLSVIYNIFGQRLVLAGTSFFPEVYELPRHSMDISLRQPITKLLELRVGIQDVLNQPRKLYRDYDRDQRYDPNKRNKLPQNDWIYQQYKPGRYYTLGINLKI